MYCSSCGGAVTPGLSYCNHCGARLKEGDRSDDVRPEALIFGMLATFVFGLIAITVMMGVLKNVMGVAVADIIAISAFPFLLLLLLEAIFIRLLLRRTKTTKETRELPKSQVTSELDAAQARALPEPARSVTEHTTRTFDPIYTERK